MRIGIDFHLTERECKGSCACVLNLQYNHRLQDIDTIHDLQKTVVC